MSWLCARNAACVSSAVDHPVPSTIAPYSPTNTSPVFGVIEALMRWVPARRQNVVELPYWFTTLWMLVPGQMSIAPAGQVMVGCGPTPVVVVTVTVTLNE